MEHPHERRLTVTESGGRGLELSRVSGVGLLDPHVHTLPPQRVELMLHVGRRGAATEQEQVARAAVHEPARDEPPDRSEAAGDQVRAIRAHRESRACVGGGERREGRSEQLAAAHRELRGRGS